MIQRIQTIYLFLALVACVACMSMAIGRFYDYAGDSLGRLYNLWLSFSDGMHSLFPWALFCILLFCATLLLMNIFLYRQQTLQLRLCVFCMVLQAGWYLAYGGLVWMRINQMAASFRPEWPAALPAVALVLTYLAMRGITRDILLLKSLDRLR
ncbi:MAG: DUF4293 domain-containing protein [Bacteroidaceae bacterium]